eukprot:NODE_1022_length_2595_cov_0.559696.p1 type:complete len:317 gc:universal NODE_1022_length_2595_cov_0.559696:736-1686(+)
MILIPSLNASQYCYNSVCFDFFIKNDLITTQFTVTGNNWASLGIGPGNMVGDMIVVWPYLNNIVVSNRKGVSEDLPKYVENSKLTFSNGTMTNTGYTINVTRPINAVDGFDYSFADSQFMVAFGSAPNSNSTNADFPEHRGNAKNAFYLNLLNTGTNNKQNHGIVMSLSWMILVPFAVLVARLKHQIGKYWFHFHRLINFCVFALSLYGLIAIWISRNGIFPSKLHVIIGFALLSTMVIQIALGFYIDKKYNAICTEIPTRDKSHWWIGYFLMFVAVINSLLQFDKNVTAYLYYIYGIGALLMCCIIATKWLKLNK